MIEGGLSVLVISLSLSTSALGFELVSVSLMASAGSGSVAVGVFLDEVNVTKSSVPTSLKQKTMTIMRETEGV